MSVASAAAPVTEPKSTPCTTVEASENCKKDSTWGKPGILVVLPNDEAPRNAKKMGKKMLGATNAG